MDKRRNLWYIHKKQHQLAIGACYNIGESQIIPSERTQIFFFTFLAMQHVGSQNPDQGWNQCPLRWKSLVLPSGPPGKSKNPDFLKYMLYDSIYMKLQEMSINV